MNLPAIIKSLDPNIHLKKHTATIHFKGSLSIIDHKILNILYKCAYESDNFSNEQYYIRVSDIVSLLGWQKNKYEDIRASFKMLRDSGFYWNIFEQDQKNKEDWEHAGGSGFIADFMITKNTDVASFSIPPLLRQLLKNPNIYAFIDLKVQNKLTGKYDLIYYEYFLDELYRNCKKETITRWYSVPEIRRMLNLSDETYPIFKNFNYCCIKEPVASINEFSNITVEIHETLRAQRKIAAFRFKIQFKDKQPENVQCSMDIDDSTVNDNFHYDVKKELSVFFGEQQAIKIIEQISFDHPDCYSNLIQSNIEYAKRKSKDGIVQSLPAFMRKAIAEDYAGYLLKVKQYNEDIEKKKIEEINKKKKEIEDEKGNIEFDKIVNEFNSLPDEIKSNIMEQCNSSNPMFKNMPEDLKKITAANYYSTNKPAILNMNN
jgi:hypothetical protein